MNIVEIAKNYLPGSLQNDVARATGESESGISKVISAAIPTILAAVLAKSSSNSGGIMDMIRNVGNSGILGNLGSVIGTNENTATTSGFNIWSILRNLLGDKLGSVVSMLSSFGGVKEASANNVLGLSSAAALGALGKYSADHNLDENGFRSFLNTQRSNIESAVPSGFNWSSLAGLLGLGGLGATAARATEPVETTRVTTPSGGTTYTREPKKGNNWLVPLLLLIAAGLLAWWLMKGCNKTEPEPVNTVDTVTNVAPADTTVTTTTTTTRTVEDIDLNGTALKGYKGGMEDRMITYLKGNEYANATEDALKNTWYDFDNVNFKMGSATELEPGSEGQIQNIANILKAYPAAKIKIGGYTDKTGNEDANKKLSQQRADFIKSELGKLGVGAQVTGAEGYGSQFATVDASASDAERAVDRKMSVRFTK